MAVLGSFVEEKANSKSLPSEIDLSGLMGLMFMIASHDSLAVSIPVLNLWTKLLRSDALSHSDAVQPFIPQLLQLSTNRLFRVGHPRIKFQEGSADCCSVRSYGRSQPASKRDLPE